MIFRYGAFFVLVVLIPIATIVVSIKATMQKKDSPG